MAVTTEQSAPGAGETFPSKPSSLQAHDDNKVYDSDATNFEQQPHGITDESDGTNLEKPVEVVTQDQYPHGLKLVALSSACLVSVFLIALDQVRSRAIFIYSC